MRLIRLLRLGPRAIVTLLRCITAVLIVRSRWFGDSFPWTRFSRANEAPNSASDLSDEAALLITPAYSLLHITPTCLEKAAALTLTLRSCGIPSQIVLGADHGEEFKAHAWVVTETGEYLRGDERYREVARL